MRISREQAEHIARRYLGDESVPLAFMGVHGSREGWFVQVGTSSFVPDVDDYPTYAIWDDPSLQGVSRATLVKLNDNNTIDTGKFDPASRSGSEESN